MLCCAVLCCAVLCCAVLCCAVLCCAVLCCAVLCCAVLCCAVFIAQLFHADKELGNQLPSHEYTNNYAPDFRLHIPVRTGKENLNTPERIARLRDELLQNISRSAFEWHAWFRSAHLSCSGTSVHKLNTGGDSCSAAST